MPTDRDNVPIMDTILGNVPALDQSGAQASFKYKVKTALKATAYTCTRGDSGTHFYSAVTTTYTLPAVATSTGCEYWFASTAVDATVTITAPAGTMVAFNNTAATSIALDQAGMMCGFIAHAVCTGTKWITTVEVGNILQVITVA